MYSDDTEAFEVFEVFVAKLEFAKHTYSHVVQWCNDNFDEGSWWYTGTENDGRIALIEFDNKDNMLLFVLRWS